MAPNSPKVQFHLGIPVHEQYFDDATMVHVQERLAESPEMTGQRRALTAAARLSAGEHALDVGSGTGVLANEMSRIVGTGGRVVGVDRSDLMIGSSRSKYPDVTFVKGDATALPVESASFQLVTSSQVLCFLHDVGAALLEMHRVLDHGGRVALLDSHWDSLVWNSRNPALMDRAVELLLEKYVDARLPARLSRYLREAGFVDIDRQVFNISNWDLTPDNYSAQTIGFIVPMMAASDAFDAKEQEAWLDSLRDVVRDGEYCFSLNRYIFTARKP